jgi:hypothetical protein
MIGIITLQPSQNTYAIVNGNCPNMKFLEAHTYGAWSLSTSNGSRLKTLHECVVLEGVVRANPIINDEKDGDLKFGVDPDKKYLDLMDPKYNKKGMVVEVICWENPDYTKYKNPKWTNPPFCKGVEPKNHPGDYPINVQDLGCCPVGIGERYNEIHPVEKIEILK